MRAAVVVLSLAAMAAQFPGVAGFVDPDGNPLPELATRATASLNPPENNITVSKLNMNARTMIGKAISVDVLTSGAHPGGWGDGPSIHCYDAQGGMPSSLDFVVDRAITDTLRAFQARNARNGLQRYAARLTGTIQKSTSRPWSLVVVDKIEFLSPDGATAWTVTRGGGAEIVPPAAASLPAKSEIPAVVPPATPYTTDSAVTAPPTESEVKPRDETALIITAIAGLVFVLSTTGLMLLIGAKRRQQADDDDGDDPAPRRR